MNRWKNYLLLGLAIAFVYFAVNFRWTHAYLVYAAHALTCDPNILVNAAQRIDQLFGSIESQPLLGCLPAPVWGQGSVIGTTNFAPGLPAVILLNVDGAQSIDVIAHEWAHAEIAQRTSVIFRTYTLPTWFDEGLAMQVDLREAYNLAALRTLQDASEPLHQPAHLEGIATPSQFFHAGPRGRLHYAMARCVLSRWSERQQKSFTAISSDWFMQIDQSTFDEAFRACQINPINPSAN